jgi:hypothetical protein
MGEISMKVLCLSILILVLIAATTLNLVTGLPEAAIDRALDATTETLQLGSWQLREFKRASQYNPDIEFLVPEASILRVDSGYSSVGRGYVFALASRADLDGKKIQIRWNVYYSFPDERDLDLLTLLVFDKAFDRTDLVDYFQEGLDGEPMMDYPHLICAEYPGPLGMEGWLGWRTDESELLDLTAWTSDYVTILIRTRDSWNGQTVVHDLDWLRIVDAGDAEVYSCDFFGTVAMEVTGTYHDYGVFLTGEEVVTALSVELSASSVTCAKPGFCLSATVTIANVTNLYGYDFTLGWDAAILKLSGIEISMPTTWNASYFIVKNNTTTDDYWLALSALPPAPAFNGTVALATLNFNITDTTLSSHAGQTIETNLDLRETMIVDNQGNSIPHTIADATASIDFVLQGDVNNDGVVNIVDVVRAAIMYGQTGSPGWIPEDINADGTIDITDVVLVANNYGKTANP